MMIRCIIIDDEPLSQDVLKKYMTDLQNLELVAVCDDAFEALSVLQKQEIDLVFLDVNMPRLSGLQFFKSLSTPPLVIFTTAYPEYALEGYEVDAVDYLLKPFSMERFLRSVNKASEKLRFKTMDKSLNDRFIWLKSDKKLHKVDTSRIRYVESCGDYVRVVTDDGNILVHETLQNMLDQLNDNRFMRVHRSFVISVDRIEYIEGNRLKIGDVDIPVGQVYKEEFHRRLNGFNGS